MSGTVNKFKSTNIYGELNVKDLISNSSVVVKSSNLTAKNATIDNIVRSTTQTTANNNDYITKGWLDNNYSNSNNSNYVDLATTQIISNKKFISPTLLGQNINLSIPTFITFLSQSTYPSENKYYVIVYI